MRTIPQRELRNDVSRVLREVAAGETVRVTVNGRAVADLVPVRDDPGPRTFVPGEEIVAAFRDVGPIDDDFLREIREPDDDDHLVG